MYTLICFYFFRITIIIIFSIIIIIIIKPVIPFWIIGQHECYSRD